MTNPFASSASQPEAPAFAVADLVRMKAWADRQGIRMVVRLDHRIGGTACEEAIAFHTGAQRACFLLIWRGAGTVMVQPSGGQPLVYRSVSHVLESLVAMQDAGMTDTMEQQ